MVHSQREEWDDITCFTDGKRCDSDCNSLIKLSVHDTVNIINCALDDLLCIHEDPFKQRALMLHLSRAPAKQENCYFPFYHSQMNANKSILHTSELWSKIMLVFEPFCTIRTMCLIREHTILIKKKREREKELERKTSSPNWQQNIRPY